MRRADRLFEIVQNLRGRRLTTAAQLAQWLDGRDGIDARLARDVLADIDRVTPVINDLERLDTIFGRS